MIRPDNLPTPILHRCRICGKWQYRHAFDAAELACNQQNGCNFNKDTSCPFSDSENPSCRLEQIREAVGEHRPPGLCEFAAWLDGYFLCKSQNECEFQDGAGPTFYCGREAAVLAFLEQEQQAGDQHEQ